MLLLLYSVYYDHAQWTVKLLLLLLHDDYYDHHAAVKNAIGPCVA